MLGKLLLCVDGSHRTGAIIATAASLATACDAAVRVLCVVDPAYYLDGIPDGADEVDFPAAATEHEAAVELVHEVALSLRDRDIDATGHVLSGTPVKTILSAAQEWECEAIVLGHRHLSWFRRLTDRSICWEVLEQARVPVLVVPDPV
ncbi:universal stress protein [Novosphingobium sp. AP12]|uniref:universal stress protein n=1 Tax=Novosphingobium sp. AP12 TaxID=1144305 RepID=UPI000271FAD3|nr:universal stress protein [Novosphingobium sp. AP12]EJL34189.1 universal stress protein UspA-like protein [Novosphingobium sp. AP12]